MRGVTFAEGEFYHLYNRGVDKRVIFTDQEEYRRFTAYLYLLNDSEKQRTDFLKNPMRLSLNGRNHEESRKAKPSAPLVAIGAYCLMPNHFHLYVTPIAQDGISKFMHRLQTAYTMYFNEKHERSGALLEGPFKAKHIQEDTHAKYLFSYIHLNPAKLVEPRWRDLGAGDLKKIRTYVRTYRYSSLEEYMSGRHAITEPSAFPSYFQGRRDIDAHIDDWLHFKDEDFSKA